MKTTFACIIFCAFSILFIPSNVKAQATATPVPVPTGTCGNDKQQCCNSKLGSADSLPLNSNTVAAGDDLCLGPLCLQGMIDMASKVLFGSIFKPPDSINGNDFSSLSSVMGTCVPDPNNDNKLPSRQLVPDPADPNKTICSCVGTGTPTEIQTNFCTTYVASTFNAQTGADVKSQPDVKSCINCFLGGGYWSALGCVQLDSFQGFIQNNIFKMGIGLAGIFALGCMIYCAIQIQLSAGSAEKVKKTQELLTSCIMGLVVIIFSIFFLRVIGVDLLRIPGFS